MMKVVIVGGSHAGICAALRAKEEFPDAEIVMYEEKAQTSFVSQGIISYLEGHTEALFQSSYLSPEEIRAAGIDFVTETTVQNIDVQAKILYFHANDSDEVFESSYDKLIFAAGSYPSMPPIEYDERCPLFFLKGKADAVAAEDFLKTAKTIAVVGGGMTGLEIARICNQRGIKTIWANANKTILSRYLDVPVAEKAEDLLREEGILIENEMRVSEVAYENGHCVLKSTTKTILADGVIFAVGFRPNSYLLSGQVELGDKGAILVDEYMRTSAADVFAVGDASTTWIERANKSYYLPHASDAVRKGEIAAINLLEARRKINSTQATYHVPMKEMTIAITGQTLKQALRAGIDVDAVEMVNPHLEGHSTSHIWLTYERRTHRIIGLQCLGKSADLAAYANIISLAIERNLTIEDLEFTDFYFEHGYKDPRGFNRILARLVRENEGK